MELSRSKFETLVDEGIAAIPEKFRARMDNVAIFVEDEPTPEQRRTMELADDESLFGLYEGVSLAERAAGYHAALPDRITIFRTPILDEARSEDEVREIVADTVWHEVAHHLGSDERAVQTAEARRARRLGNA